jgi:hypothetical protein
VMSCFVFRAALRWRPESFTAAVLLDRGAG